MVNILNKKKRGKTVMGALLIPTLIVGTMGYNMKVHAATRTERWSDSKMDYTYKATAVAAQTKRKDFEGTRFYWKRNCSSTTVSLAQSETNTFAVSFTVSGEANVKIIKVNAALGFQYSHSSTQTTGVAYTLNKKDPKGTYVISSYCPGKKITTTLSGVSKTTGKKITINQNSEFAPTTKAITKTLNYTAN